MKLNDVSEEALAPAAGLSRAALRSKLTDDRLSVPELDRIARALGTKASVILAEAEKCGRRVAARSRSGPRQRAARA